MENLTWRMMALALRKKKEDEEKEKERIKLEERPIKEEKPAENIQETLAASSSSARPPGSSPFAEEDSERGRSKGKTRVKVVGFDGTNQDGVEDTECVLLF